MASAFSNNNITKSEDYSESYGSADDLDAVMVFDGICNFCSVLVRMIVLADREAIVRFVPTQSPLGITLCERNGVDPADPTTFLFYDRGQVYQASTAMARLAGRLPSPWRWLRALHLLPLSMRDAGYRFIARRRYTIMGRQDECRVPDLALRARFLDFG